MVVRIGLILCVALASLGVSKPLLAYSPDHPVVVDMIDRAMNYMRTAGINKAEENVGGPEGEAMMMAYATYKVNHEKNDAVVKRGVQAAVALTRTLAQSVSVKHSKMNYKGSLAIILLAEVDHKAHKGPIQQIANFIFGHQKPHGGFGYFNEEHGDNSQTQYVVLAMWTMQKKGFDVPGTRMERAITYLLSVQDPGGSWAYKTNSIGSPNALVKQGRVTHTMLAAGAGSCLIGGDFFEFYKGTEKKDNDSGLPPALKKLDEDADIQVKSKSAQKITPELVLGAKSRAMGHLRKSPYVYTSHTWTYYALYCYERFHSFREIAEGSVEAEPDWYNKGVEQLRKLQKPSGEFSKGGYSSEQVATSLAVLFLIRSTKRALQEVSEGVMSGGQGLPKDTKDMRAKGAQLVGKPVASSVTSLLDLLSDEGANDLDEKVIPDDLVLAKDPEQRADQIKRLKRMIRGGPWQARRAAARLLGQSSDLDIVPTLIFGLTDEDTIVRRESRNGLRFVSRKFEGFDLPDDPSKTEVDEAVKAWRDWYQRVNPAYVFLDL